MSRSIRPPSYRFQKARKCAVVTIYGKNRYLGPYGSPGSHEAYERWLAKWRSANESSSATVVIDDSPGDITVNWVILKYLTFAAGYYRKHDEPTDEIRNIRAALSALKKLYGRTLAQAFGPKDLELVRNSHAITRACRHAKVPHWRPNQLRHNCGTKIHRINGLDGAAAVLGHRLGTVTEIYAEADLQKAIDIMREIG